MGAQKESALSLRIKNRLEEVFPGSWWVKTSGNSLRGTPDLLGCLEGHMVGLEVKMPGRENEVTEIQRAVLEDIEKAGGIALVSSSPGEAVNALASSLAVLRSASPDASLRSGS